MPEMRLITEPAVTFMDSKVLHTIVAGVGDCTEEHVGERCECGTTRCGRKGALLFATRSAGDKRCARCDPPDMNQCLACGYFFEPSPWLGGNEEYLACDEHRLGEPRRCGVCGRRGRLHEGAKIQLAGDPEPLFVCYLGCLVTLLSQRGVAREFEREEKFEPDEERSPT